MSGFLKRLFGAGGGSGEAASAALEPVAYNGYIIQPEPKRNDGHFNIAGSIVREDAPHGEAHRFIRADTYTSLEDAAAWSVRKAKQIIDEQGERLLPKSQ